MRMIWGLLALAVLATAGWGGYWFVGARALERAVPQMLAANSALSADSHAVRGFPNRFDLTLTEPRLDTPDLAWQAPFVQLFALSYRPHHLIAVFANDQSGRVLGHEVTLHVDDMRASVVMEPTAALPLDRVALVAEQPRLRAEDATHLADSARFASRALEPHRHEVAVEVAQVIPDAALMARLDPAAHWPRRFERAGISAELEFDRALDRLALDGPSPEVTGLVLTGAQLHWDGVQIDGNGRLERGVTGLLSGEMTVTVQGWAALMDHVRAAGLIVPEQEALMLFVLRALVDPADADRLLATFTVQDGMVMLGPLTLGFLPPVL